MEASTCVSSQHWKGKSTDQSHFLHNEVDTLQAVELSASIDKHLPRNGSDRWITLLCCLHLPLWPYGLEWESSYRV